MTIEQRKKFTESFQGLIEVIEAEAEERATTRLRLAVGLPRAGYVLEASLSAYIRDGRTAFEVVDLTIRQTE